MITFTEWQKLELRIGSVKKAEVHPNADRLIVLQVDLGDEERQIVAGLKQYYSPEELAGKSVVVLTNLEPAELRGVQSNGMLLAAVDKEQDVVSILTTEKDVPPGTKVS